MHKPFKTYCVCARMYADNASELNSGLIHLQSESEACV